MSFFKVNRDSKTGQFVVVGPGSGSYQSVSSKSGKSTSPVFQTFTLPDGKKISYMRKDAFNRAIDSVKKG